MLAFPTASGDRVSLIFEVPNEPLLRERRQEGGEDREQETCVQEIRCDAISPGRSRPYRGDIDAVSFRNLGGIQGVKDGAEEVCRLSACIPLRVR